MSNRTDLERRYRRLLACYPRAFRREHEEEMLVVLMACARDGQRSPTLRDRLNLLCHAARQRVRPGAPRSVPTVFWAVRLMLLGGVLELAALATVLATQTNLRAAIARNIPGLAGPHGSAVVHAHILPVEIGAPVAAAVWLVLAWANGRGHPWARALMVGLLLLTSISLLSAIGQHAATYAPADIVAGSAVWLVALTATMLTLSSGSNRHYDGQSAGRRRPPASVTPRVTAG